MRSKYQYIHIAIEIVVLAGIFYYLFKKIMALETIIKENNLLPSPLSALKPTVNNNNPITTALIDSPSEAYTRASTSVPQRASTSFEQRCEGNICKLVQPKEKKVAISKISTKAEFNDGGIINQPQKINTFTNFSPNPVLMSVTPSLVASVENSDLAKILKKIDDE